METTNYYLANIYPENSPEEVYERGYKFQKVIGPAVS